MILLLAGITFVVTTALATGLVRGLQSLASLSRSRPLDGAAPEVSIVVAARDEARAISGAVTSLLDQDYPDFEVVVVDDRSSDGTGALLDRLAAERTRLRVIHLTELPAGWLGKNHALERGAGLASGELLLFTDADVVMRPDTLARAVALFQDRRLDHLAVAPQLHAAGAWAMLTLAVFLALFATLFRPWRASDPDSGAHIGIGAFNLVRTEAYRGIGGHRAVALRPDDDVRLGAALKAAGYRQDAATGRDHLEVEWYPSLRAMARGLRKNAFAVVEYRLAPVVAWTALALLVAVWPVAALVLTTGVGWWLNLGVVTVAGLTMAAVARCHGLPIWTALTYPVGAVLLTWIVWSAALLALRTGSVEWRGTYYSLDELRGR